MSGGFLFCRFQQQPSVSISLFFGLVFNVSWKCVNCIMISVLFMSLSFCIIKCYLQEVHKYAHQSAIALKQVVGFNVVPDICI